MKLLHELPLFRTLRRARAARRARTQPTYTITVPAPLSPARTVAWPATAPQAQTGQPACSSAASGG